MQLHSTRKESPRVPIVSNKKPKQMKTKPSPRHLLNKHTTLPKHAAADALQQHLLNTKQKHPWVTKSVSKIISNMSKYFSFTQTLLAG